MKNKRGFTLIELLAVIVILAVIALIVSFVIGDVITDTKNSAYQDSVYMIENAAELYSVTEIEGEFTSVTVQELVDANLLKSIPKDPRTNEEMTGTVTYSNGNFEYDSDLVEEPEEILTREVAVGDILLAPEEGWQRIDATSTNMTISSAVTFDATYGIPNTYNDSHMWGLGETATIEFIFKGTALRINGVSQTIPDVNAYTIEVDGQTYNVEPYSISREDSVLMFEIVDLSDSEHIVKLAGTPGDYVNLDSIDINAQGYLKEI